MNNKIIIILSLVICSCSNDLNEINRTKVDLFKTTHEDFYNNSDRLLNIAFNELVNTAPDLLKANLKKDQKAWLIQRGEACDDDGFNHPNNIKSLDCFTEQNEQQLEIINQRKIILKDLLDSRLTGLSLSNTNNYIVDFQANCLCGNFIPYIDSHSVHLLTYSSCLSTNNKPLNSEEITNIKFDEFEKLTVEALNKYGTAYQISFDPKGNHIYSILLFGKWGVIKEKTKKMVEAVGVASIYGSQINNVCSDFDG